MIFLEDRPRIGAVRANSQSTMAVVIRNMYAIDRPYMPKNRGRLDSIHLFSHAKRRRLFDSLQCLMQDLMSVSLRSSISGNSSKRKFFEVQFPEILVCVLIHPFSRTTPNPKFLSTTCSKNSTSLASTSARKPSKDISGPLNPS